MHFPLKAAVGENLTVICVVLLVQESGSCPFPEPSTQDGIAALVSVSVTLNGTVTEVVEPEVTVCGVGWNPILVEVVHAAEVPLTSTQFVPLPVTATAFPAPSPASTLVVVAMDAPAADCQIEPL